VRGDPRVTVHHVPINGDKAGCTTVSEIVSKR
jgi:hypothetical protein